MGIASCGSTSTVDVMRSTAATIQTPNVLLIHSLQNFRKSGVQRWPAAARTLPGVLYGCEKKGVAGRAIRKVMKIKGDGKWRVASDEWREKSGLAGEMDDAEAGAEGGRGSAWRLA